MSEKILKALMELFAIIVRPEDNITSVEERVPVVESFLRRQLNQELVPAYLSDYNKYQQRHQDLFNKRGDKRVGAISVRILRICQEANPELTQRQKLIILLHLFEFVLSKDNSVTDQEYEYIAAVSDVFNIPRYEHDEIRDFITHDASKAPDTLNVLVVSNNNIARNDQNKHLTSKHLKGQIWILHIESDNLFILRYLGEHELYLNGQLLSSDKVFVFNTGSSIRDHNITPIYYSDVANLFHSEGKESKIIFEANDISFKFKNGKIGLHPLNFQEKSGRLIGIMGASGAGKSTLLNVLNGSSEPFTGSIKINGNDIYKEKDDVEGLIGFVSQDDLLIEELTVFQNLYFNARLCFGDYTEEQLAKTVDRVLVSLGLFEIKDIQVGSPLNKKISGGQRKRLNIALELIREPAILFLDEPTSGLSSRDSENIMDLLKELSLKGKLVFTVIHQPSSDIFKMFDKLVILDTGGYLIYEGDPIESILYFKQKIHHANYNESECQRCGNVNPEQLFNIIESNVLDEYGKFTQKRKISPQEWYQFQIEESKKKQSVTPESSDLPKISFKIPNQLKQFKVFATRDILSKLANTQYLVVNFLEAPLLGFILSFLIKYYDVSETNEFGYNFQGNSNIPVYIFMSVIVAIFMGLTVSAEEIIKDRKILKREAFLNLSWSSYLLSKVGVLIILSAIQSLTFVLVGNSILEIKGMYLFYWLALFSCWVSANILGLVISDSFKTVVTIYILIPFLVIPQIILSGIIVKYEKLNPSISSPDRIPFYGEIITARWGYEALAVQQFKNNEYMKNYYQLNKLMSQAEFKKYYWKNNLLNKLDYIEKHVNGSKKTADFNYYLELLRNEILKENTNNKLIQFNYTDKLYPEKITPEIVDSTRQYFKRVNRMYIRVYNRANEQKDAIIRSQQKTPESKDAFHEFKRNYHNDKLTDFVENFNETVKIIEYKSRLIQKDDPIYLDPEHKLLKAHFYAPRKKLLNNYYDTYWVNIGVIWFMSLILFILLYFRLLKRFLESTERFSNKENNKKQKSQ